MNSLSLKGICKGDNNLGSFIIVMFAHDSLLLKVQKPQLKKGAEKSKENPQTNQQQMLLTIFKI